MLPIPLAGFKGPTCKAGEGRGEEWEGEGGERGGVKNGTVRTRERGG